MKRKSLYIRIGVYILVCLVVLLIVFYVFWYNRNYTEGNENPVSEAVLDASANMQRYRDFGKLLGNYQSKLYTEGLERRLNENNYYNKTQLEKDNYCYTKEPTNILGDQFYKSNEFTVCDPRKRVQKDPYKPTIITYDTGRSVNVAIPKGVVSFEYIVVGGGGAGGGGGAKFGNISPQNGGGGGGGGSSGEVIKGKVDSLNGLKEINVTIGNGGPGNRFGFRYTHNNFYKRKIDDYKKRFKQEKEYYKFKDGGKNVYREKETNFDMVKTEPQSYYIDSNTRDRTSAMRNGGSTTLQFGNIYVTARGGYGGDIGGNMGMTPYNRKLIQGNNGNLYPELPGFGSFGAFAVSHLSQPGNNGYDGNPNQGPNMSKGGQGGQSGVPDGYGSGGKGGDGGTQSNPDGQYGESGRHGAVILYWK